MRCVVSDHQADEVYSHGHHASVLASHGARTAATSGDRRTCFEPAAGRRLLGWAHAAGLSQVTASASTWCYADDAARRHWAHTWADRVLASAFADGVRRHDLAIDAELRQMARAWRDWPGADSWFAVLHGEIVARR